MLAVLCARGRLPFYIVGDKGYSRNKDCITVPNTF